MQGEESPPITESDEDEAERHDDPPDDAPPITVDETAETHEPVNTSDVNKLRAAIREKRRLAQHSLTNAEKAESRIRHG